MSLRFKVSLAVLVLLIAAGCGPAGAYDATEAPMAEPFLFEPVNTPTLAPPEEQITEAAAPTETPAPTMIAPTEAVPTLEPPTPTSMPAPLTPEPTWTPATPGAWTGQPTYPESQAGMFFLVTYDFSVWTYAEDDFGLPGLSHRALPGCSISPTIGRGLSPDWTVESVFRNLGTLSFEVVTISQNGQIQYLNYYGGDGIIFTGFRVTFGDRVEACLQDAEAVLATLSSVPAPTAP